MASHHPLHHHYCQNPAPITTITATTCCCCSCRYRHCCTQSPPPQYSPIDPLGEALHQQQRQPPNLYSSYPTKSQTQKNLRSNLHFHRQNLNFQHLDQELGEDSQTQFVLSYLLQRIATLESSLYHFSASNTHCHSHSHSPYSLREAAARIIQTHFRAFLVRRSRTLTQLQDLAFIKSSFNSIKSCVSNKIHFNSEVVSHNAMNLLLKLDSIRSGDPMIRDGKRSISRDIVRFLEFIDGLAAKRHGNLYKPAKNLRFVRNSNKSRALNARIGYGDVSGHQKVMVENSRDRVEKIPGFSRVCDNDEEDVELEGFQQFIDGEDDEVENVKVSVNEKHYIPEIRNGVLIKSNGSKPRVKKTVSFAENRNVYRVFSDNLESVSSGDGSSTDGSDASDDQGEPTACNEIEGRNGTSRGAEKVEVAQNENIASSQSNISERNSPRNSRGGEGYEINIYCQDQDGSLVFSAPVPVKMESRADLMKKRKAVKLVK